MTKKLESSQGILLDRDGVVLELIKKEGEYTSISSPDHITYRSGLSEFLDFAGNNDFTICIITNQPDISRGMQSAFQVERIHNQILTDNPSISKVLCCPHDSLDLCSCRKPKPGLIFEAASSLHLDLSHSFLVGDRQSDLEAAQAAGCEFILFKSQATSENAEASASNVASTWREVMQIVQAKLTAWFM